MHQAPNALTTEPRKVRLLPGLRLELCEHAAHAKLTPDEALGLANSIIVNTREALYQSGPSAYPTLVPCPGLTARANPDCVTLSLWHQGVEMVATLSRAQSEALAKTITRKSSILQINCNLHQFRTAFAS